MPKPQKKKNKEKLFLSSGSAIIKKQGMGKKGQFADILGGIQRFIGWFLDTVPGPIKFLLFLLFLVLFGSLFGFMLNATGNFCDTAGNEYTTGFFSVATNFKLLLSMPDNEQLDSEVINVDDTPIYDRTVMDCGLLVPGAESFKIKYSNGSVQTIDNDEYFFHDTGRCTLCEEKVKIWGSGGTIFASRYCADDILYPKPYDERNWWGKQYCGKSLGSCSIPDGYYYRRADNVFVCNDDLCRNENGSVSTVGKRWNLLLRDSGAKLKEPSAYGDRDYRNALSVECEPGDVRPKFRFYGIEIFNYQLWIIIMVISLITWAFFKLKK